MDQLSDEDKKKYQMKKMFDVCEVPIMKYLSYYFGSSVKEVFGDDANPDGYVEPLIFLPSDTLGEKYLQLSLELEPSEYKLDLGELDKVPGIIDGINFMNACIVNIYPYMAQAVDDKFKMQEESLHLEFDDYSNSFILFYVHPLRREKMYLERLLLQLDDVKNPPEVDGVKPEPEWDSLDSEQKAQWEDSRGKIMHILNTKFTLTDDEMSALEKNKNAVLSKMNKLGIKLTYLTYDELPDHFREGVDRINSQQQSVEEVPNDDEESPLLEKLESMDLNESVETRDNNLV